MAITLSYSAFMQPFFMGWIINPTYSSFFIAGVTFYLIHKNGIDIFYLSILLLSLALSSISIANGIEIYIKNPSLADQVIAVSIIVSFYILFFYMATNRFNVKKRNIYMILGGLTYPLYLTHNIIGKTIIDYYRPNNPEWLVVIVTIVIMLMLSYIIHIHFEKKMSLPIKKVLMNTAKKHASFFGIQHKH
jgi:peptidoglycan/LPS O-acetylase OafA/YrhL